MFACFFQTNFPNIPFLKSNLLSFLAVSFFLLFLFLFWLCMFQPFCFLLLCWLCFWCFFWFCFVFCFYLLSCFGSSLWKNCFPCNSSVFWVLLVKRVVWFYVLCFCYCFVCLVLFLSILKNSFVLFCFLCCLFCDKTKWSSCLHLVVLLPFLFFVCFVLNFVFFLLFSFLSKKDPPKTRTQQKPKKAKMQKNQTKKKSVSAVVFTDSVLNFWGGLKNFIFGWKHYKNSGFSIFSNR